ncbi:biliverdin-producing heme oxygenase [Polluticoccus soli]|uniref:biliverdin-producing heme oxygenase n=1 Tax=Polluticoccus soli TaxID=3034150 RepID=UPI0023E2BB60|nr:biliverdin-producing heme oxygenase [Flavipsychrobacter sp. JY13-12]
MLLDKLKAYTSGSHQELEKLIIPRIKQATDKDAYRNVLQLFYGYFKPLEELVSKHVDHTLLPDYEERRKTSALLSDIHYLCGSQNALKLCDDLPLIGNSRQAIGALYVMEGSTLGGKIIKGILMKNLDADGSKGFDFFGGYGDDTEKKWSAFKQIINDRFSDAETHHEILAAADNTFKKFRSWAEIN